jgi:hypothetical protein
MALAVAAFERLSQVRDDDESSATPNINPRSQQYKQALTDATLEPRQAVHVFLCPLDGGMVAPPGCPVLFEGVDGGTYSVSALLWGGGSRRSVAWGGARRLIDRF